MYMNVFFFLGNYNKLPRATPNPTLDPTPTINVAKTKRGTWDTNRLFRCDQQMIVFFCSLRSPFRHHKSTLYHSFYSLYPCFFLLFTL